MPPEPDAQRTKRRREKLLSLGLIQKNVWVPAIFASALMAFAFELRRRAGVLLPTDPCEGGGTSHDTVASKLVDGQAPIIQQAAAKVVRGETANGARARGKRQ